MSSPQEFQVGSQITARTPHGIFFNNLQGN